MSMHVITGGSASGKSAYAETFLLELGKEDRAKGLPYIYIATMFPYGEETTEKIQRHRRMRQEKGFETVECYTNLSAIKVPKHAGVLLECISNLTANELYMEEGAGKNTKKAVLDGVASLAQQSSRLVIVTNEISSDIYTYSADTVQYQRLVGSVNQELARMADTVTEVVYGIPLVVKKEKNHETMD